LVCVYITKFDSHKFAPCKSLNSFFIIRQPPNGLRYPLVGGTRQHHFAGTSFKPQSLPENAQTPTSRVHPRKMGFDKLNPAAGHHFPERI
jgi:hypothetical protein